MTEVLSVSPVLVELARKQVLDLEAAGQTPPVALRRIAEARLVPRTARPVNGVPINGVPVNGVPINGVPASGTAAAGHSTP